MIGGGWREARGGEGRDGGGGEGGAPSVSLLLAPTAGIVAHTLLVAHRVCSVPTVRTDHSIGISGAIHVTVFAPAAVIGCVERSRHPSNNGDAADELADAGDEEQHHRLRAGVAGGPLLGLAWVGLGLWASAPS